MNDQSKKIQFRIGSSDPLLPFFGTRTAKTMNQIARKALYEYLLRERGLEIVQKYEEIARLIARVSVLESRIGVAGSTEQQGMVSPELVISSAPESAVAEIDVLVPEVEAEAETQEAYLDRALQGVEFARAFLPK